MSPKFRFSDSVIGSVTKLLKLFKGQRETIKKRSRSFTVKNGDIDLDRKEKSLKLHHIAKKDFVISTEKERKNTKSSKAFIPGVERKKLRKKNETGESQNSDEISIMKATPTPEIFKLEDEEEMEGGEQDAEPESGSSYPENSITKKRKRRQKNLKSYNEINQSEHSKRYNDSSIEVDSEENKSDYHQSKRSKKALAKQNLYIQNDDISEDIDDIDDIPLSAFESSQSSSSDDTFESIENDELLHNLKKERTPIVIEHFSDEECKRNEAEEIMASLSDIAIEIDENIKDARQNGMSHISPKNRQSMFKKSEVGIRLPPDNSIEDLHTENDFVQRADTNLAIPSNLKLIDDIKSVNSPEFEKIQRDNMVNDSLKDLELRMMDSSKF